MKSFIKRSIFECSDQTQDSARNNGVVRPNRHTGSQSIKISLSRPNAVDKGCWRRVSVASIGIKGPIGCLLQIRQCSIDAPIAKATGVDMKNDLLQESDPDLDLANLLKAWTPIKCHV